MTNVPSLRLLASEEIPWVSGAGRLTIKRIQKRMKNAGERGKRGWCWYVAKRWKMSLWLAVEEEALMVTLLFHDAGPCVGVCLCG